MREMVSGPGQGTTTASKTTDVRCMTPLGDHKTENDDEEDKPSAGETIWTNTGGKRSSRV